MSVQFSVKSGEAPLDEERRYYDLQRKVWPKLAPFYDLVTFPIRSLRSQVVRLSGAGAASKVLDVATGTGDQALAFAPTGADVVGIDLSPAMLHIARRKNRHENVHFQQGDATNLPFDDATFDICCVSFALHEMPGDVRQRALREMARVTKARGAIIVVDYALPRGALASAIAYRLVKLYERDNYAEFVRGDLETMLRRAGIAVEQTRSALRGNVVVVAGRPVTAAAGTADRARGAQA
jgi:demethylmenaquinone methyltransferase/2-methoxy-6-polyprenyl-1,4-benzoquinol methylase